MANLDNASKIEQVVLPPKTEVLPSSTPEKTPEKLAEQVTVEKKLEKEIKVSTEKTEGATTNPSSPAPSDAYHLRREQEIDAFLSEGLGETFLAMSPAKQKEFKEEGEKTARKINILLDSAKINIGKIVTLIRRWLSLIVGVNRFFLDQEAKIKADKIIKIKNKV